MPSIEDFRKRFDDIKKRKKELLDKQIARDQKIGKLLLEAVKNLLYGNWGKSLECVGKVFEIVYNTIK